MRAHPPPPLRTWCSRSPYTTARLRGATPRVIRTHVRPSRVLLSARCIRYSDLPEYWPRYTAADGRPVTPCCGVIVAVIIAQHDPTTLHYTRPTPFRLSLCSQSASTLSSTSSLPSIAALQRNISLDDERYSNHPRDTILIVHSPAVATSLITDVSVLISPPADARRPTASTRPRPRSDSPTRPTTLNLCPESLSPPQNWQAPSGAASPRKEEVC